MFVFRSASANAESKRPNFSIRRHHDRETATRRYAHLSVDGPAFFGTYHCPDHEPESFGIKEAIPCSYLGQLLHPFVPRVPIIDASGFAQSTESMEVQEEVIGESSIARSIAAG